MSRTSPRLHSMRWRVVTAILILLLAVCGIYVLSTRDKTADGGVEIVVGTTLQTYLSAENDGTSTPLLTALEDVSVRPALLQKLVLFDSDGDRVEIVTSEADGYTLLAQDERLSVQNETGVCVIDNLTRIYLPTDADSVKKSFE